MDPEKQTLGPWKAIQGILELGETPPPAHHPSHRVLREYLSENLPDRPSRWTLERAQALAEGTVSDWTAWEVATHLAICTRCCARVERLEHQLIQRWREFLRDWHERARRPWPAPVGWGMAGVQALVIIALACWLALSPSPGSKVVLPDLLNGVSESPLNAGFVVRFVRFHEDVQLGELSDFLNKLKAEIRGGPAEDGEYTVYVPIGAQETLEESQHVRSVRTPEQAGVALSMDAGFWDQRQAEAGKGSKVPWDVHQEALHWQGPATPSVLTPMQDLLLTTSEELPQEEVIRRLVEAGYTPRAIVGTTVLVSAPITLYIDPENGLEQLDFVTMSLHPVENRPN